MIVSDWSDWFLCVVELVDFEMVVIWYLGCNGFVIKGSEGMMLFVDLYVGIGDLLWMVCMIFVLFDFEDVIEVDVVFVMYEYMDYVYGQS